MRTRIAILLVAILLLAIVAVISIFFVSDSMNNSMHLHFKCDYDHNIGIWQTDYGILRMTETEYGRYCTNE